MAFPVIAGAVAAVAEMDVVIASISYGAMEFNISVSVLAAFGTAVEFLGFVLGEHTKGKRRSTQEKHQKGQSRQQRDQKRKEERQKKRK